MTRSEWVVLTVKESCAADGHAPTIRLATLGDPIGTRLCECGAVRWAPQ